MPLLCAGGCPGVVGVGGVGVGFVPPMGCGVDMKSFAMSHRPACCCGRDVDEVGVVGLLFIFANVSGDVPLVVPPPGFPNGWVAPAFIFANASGDVPLVVPPPGFPNGWVGVDAIEVTSGCCIDVSVSPDNSSKIFIPLSLLSAHGSVDTTGVYWGV